MQFKCKVTIIILLFVVLQNVNSQNWEVRTLHSINETESTKGYSIFISNTTRTIVFATPLTLGAVALIKKNDELLKDAAYLGATSIIAALLTDGMKRSINRARPAETYPFLINAHSMTKDRAFPSGHASSAFALATSLTLKYPKWYVVAPAYFWASSVGYSRMNLGMHYPSDVAAGAVLGAGSAYLTYLINDWFWKKHDNKKLLSDTSYWN
ncbi:MAG: phosphatase PAP2 family protein [Paludibacteraceae bacterium]